MKKSIDDLYDLLYQQSGDIKTLLANTENLKEQFIRHENNDNRIHASLTEKLDTETKELHARVSSLKKYGGAISIVSLVIGFFVSLRG